MVTRKGAMMTEESDDALGSRQHRVVSVIRAEHRSLSAVLWSLNYLAREAGTEPDFELFSLMIDYIDLFPERLHHPKEDQHLFTALRTRTADAEPILQELTAEHARGAHMIDDLRYALTRYRLAGADGRAQFAAAVQAYAEFHWNHMRREEEVLLPLAERVLAHDDWRAIDAAFSETSDPLLGPEARAALRGLFQTILELAPPPVGLGSARGVSKPSARR
jgi:hemerythrin-like domain-containing protein